MRDTVEQQAALSGAYQCSKIRASDNAKRFICAYLDENIDDGLLDIFRCQCPFAQTLEHAADQHAAEAMHVEILIKMVVLKPRVCGCVRLNANAVVQLSKEKQQKEKKRKREERRMETSKTKNAWIPTRSCWTE